MIVFPLQGEARPALQLFGFFIITDDGVQFRGHTERGTHMFHTQAAWRSEDGIDVFRAISGNPTLQRFSLVEIVSHMPTYEVDLAFLDDEGEQCWRKFFCTEIAKLAHLVLGEGVLTSRVSVISVGRSKNISIGDEVFEIYETSRGDNLSSFFCKTANGVLLSDEIYEAAPALSGAAKSIWKYRVF